MRSTTTRQNSTMNIDSDHIERCVWITLQSNKHTVWVHLSACYWRRFFFVKKLKQFIFTDFKCYFVIFKSSIFRSIKLNQSKKLNNIVHCLFICWFWFIAFEFKLEMIPQRRRGVRLCAHGQNDQENRSILLQNFLKRRCPNLKLNDIIRHVCEFACDRDGSEFIESQWTTEQNNFFIFAEMQPNLLMLMKDQFANNIMQKIIEIGNKEQCQWILEIVKSHLMDLGSHKYGCHVVQRAIEYDLKNYNQEHSILHQFYGKNIVALAQDKYGSYVVQFLFRSISDPTLQVGEPVKSCAAQMKLHYTTFKFEYSNDFPDKSVHTLASIRLGTVCWCARLPRDSMHLEAWNWWADSNERVKSNRTASAGNGWTSVRQLCHTMCNWWVMRRNHMPICIRDWFIHIFLFISIQNFVHRWSKTVSLTSFWGMWSICPATSIRRMWSKSAFVAQLLYKESKQWIWFVHLNHSKYCHLRGRMSCTSF